MKNKHDLSKEVELNKFKLDDEAAKNPCYLQIYGEQAAESRAERDYLEREVKRIRAKRELFYRRNPPTDLKVTEAVISALVDDDAEVQKAEDEYLAAKEETNTYEVAVDAFRDKSDMIKVLTTQFQTGYFAVSQAEKL